MSRRLRQHARPDTCVQGRKQFTIAVDGAQLGKHVKGGVATEVRQPKHLTFRSLSDALVDPGNMVDVDGSKAGAALR